MAQKKKGKLIVIDGSDGAGKATQTKLLVSTLKREGYKVKTLYFPRYNKSLFGRLIGECLSGEYGDFVKLDPHIASVLYAADRFEAKGEIEEALAQGSVVVLDRYVSANQIHQGGKIANPKKRREFLRWLDAMEHTAFGLPRPDHIFFLYVPYDISRQLLSGKDQADKKKVYLKRGKKDIVETNRKYLENSTRSALKLVSELNAWTKIECAIRGQMRSREEIHEELWSQVRKIVKK